MEPKCRSCYCVQLDVSMSSSETGEELLILKAKYGRLDENTCTDTPSEMTFCNSALAAVRVRDRYASLNTIAVSNVCDSFI